MNLAQIESEVLALPVEDRATLAQRLLLSLEEVSQAEFEHLWGEESALRATNFDAGKIEAISGEDVAKKARSLLR